jgi:hypothetical protein
VLIDQPRLIGGPPRSFPYLAQGEVLNKADGGCVIRLVSVDRLATGQNDKSLERLAHKLPIQVQNLGKTLIVFLQPWDQPFGDLQIIRSRQHSVEGVIGLLHYQKDRIEGYGCVVEVRRHEFERQ